MWNTLQLMRDANKRTVWAVPNADHLPPRSFDEPASGHYVPRWGTVALLKLAAQAKHVGLTVTDVTFRDTAQLPLLPEEAEHLSEEMVAALRAEDFDWAQRLLEGDRGPYTVVGVHLLAEDGGRFVVGRFGGVEVSDDEPVSPLVAAAESILNLS